MQDSNEVSRRSFLKKSTGVAAGASAFTIIKPELVRGAGNEKLKAGLIGCGQRGTEAASQLLHGNENVELVAMGDIFEDHLEASLDNIRNSESIRYTIANGRVFDAMTMNETGNHPRNRQPFYFELPGNDSWGLTTAAATDDDDVN